MKRAVLYLRTSTSDQNAQTQLYDLRELARQRKLEVIREYRDEGFSGARARRPALDQMMSEARRGGFDIVLVWAADRLARSTRHFLETLDELSRLGVEFVSLRENMDTGGALGRAVITIVSAVAELERSLIRERVRAGMRRARLEGQRLGRPPLALDRQEIVRERERGLSLGQIAKRHAVSRTTIKRIIDDVPKGCLQAPLQPKENRRPETAA
jgi:DNA invertase Pin-like site-specific DNA recombinase